MKQAMNYPANRSNWMPSVLTMFDELFDQNTLKEFPFVKSVPMNIKQLEGKFEVELAAPGFKKEDFKIELEKDLLYVSAEVSKSNETQENGTYKRREFTTTTFQRSVRLAENIDTENISAIYTDGVLAISLPIKANPEKANRSITIS